MVMFSLNGCSTVDKPSVRFPCCSYYSFRCFSFPSAGYVHDIPNMYIKAAAQVLSVLSVVQKGPICTAMY